LIRSPRHAFTLTEVLVALALAGVVATLAVLLLTTTRRVVQELRTPIRSPLAGFRDALQWELDHLMADPPNKDHKALMFAPEAGMTMVSLLTDTNGIPHPHRILYRDEGSDLIRISTGGIPITSVTTLVAKGVRTFEVRGWVEGGELEEWPVPEGPNLPLRIGIELSTQTGDHLSTTLDIPAAFRMESTE